MLRHAVGVLALTTLAASLALGQVALADDEVESGIQKSVEEYNAAEDNNTQKVVCKKEATTGTRIKKTVCRTVATMRADEESARRMLDRIPQTNPKSE